MKKVITSAEIYEAKKAGKNSLSVAPGALITPQAKDDAKRYGMTLCVSGQGLRTGETSGVKNTESTVQEQVSKVNLSGLKHAVEQLERRPTHIMARQDPAMPCNTLLPGSTYTLAAEVRRKVLALCQKNKLPAEVLAPEIDRVIAEVIAENLCSMASASGFVPFPDANQIKTAVCRPNICRSATMLPGEVLIEEVSADSAGHGTTRVTWEASSIYWVFDGDEEITVREGELEAEGKVFAPGETLRVQKGRKLFLKARGRTSCVFSSRPV